MDFNQNRVPSPPFIWIATSLGAFTRRPPAVNVLLQLPASLSPAPFACVSAALSADEPVLCLQIPCAHHLSWHHGPRRSQTETHGRQNPRILFLTCKELLIKKQPGENLPVCCGFVSPMVFHHPYGVHFTWTHTEEAVGGLFFFFFQAMSC